MILDFKTACQKGKTDHVSVMNVSVGRLHEFVVYVPIDQVAYSHVCLASKHMQRFLKKEDQ